jgi:hypothetical protein
MMHRFMVLNYPGHLDIARYFASKQEARSLIDVSLLREGRWPGRPRLDWRRLFIASGASDRPLHPPLWTLTGIPCMRTACVCYPCMAAGFHSVWLAGPFLPCCPIHGSPIIERCPACGELISGRLSIWAAHNPGHCPCGWRFMSVTQAARGSDPIDGMERLDAYVTWLHQHHEAIARALPPGASRRELQMPVWANIRRRWILTMPGELCEFLMRSLTQSEAPVASILVPRALDAHIASRAWRCIGSPGDGIAESGHMENPVAPMAPETTGRWMLSCVKSLRRHVWGRHGHAFDHLPRIDHPLAANRFETVSSQEFAWQQHSARSSWDTDLMDRMLGRLASDIPGEAVSRERAGWYWLRRTVTLPQSTIGSALFAWLSQHLACEVALVALDETLRRAAGVAPRPIQFAWRLEPQATGEPALFVDRDRRPLSLMRAPEVVRRWRCVLLPGANWAVRRGDCGVPSRIPGTMLAELPARYARRAFALTGRSTVLQCAASDLEVIGETVGEAAQLQRAVLRYHARLMRALDYAIPPSGAQSPLAWYLPEDSLHPRREEARYMNTRLKHRSGFYDG